MPSPEISAAVCTAPHGPDIFPHVDYLVATLLRWTPLRCLLRLQRVVISGADIPNWACRSRLSTPRSLRLNLPLRTAAMEPRKTPSGASLGGRAGYRSRFRFSSCNDKGQFVGSLWTQLFLIKIAW